MISLSANEGTDCYSFCQNSVRSASTRCTRIQRIEALEGISGCPLFRSSGILLTIFKNLVSDVTIKDER